MLTKKSQSPQIKIMDFGLSKFLTKYDLTTEGYGSLCYLAPEILLKKEYDHKVDIWSLGVNIYYMMTGLLPFDDSKDEVIKIAQKIVKIDVNTLLQDKAKNLSKNAKLLISKCFERNPIKRICIDKLIDHEWFCNY